MDTGDCVAIYAAVVSTAVGAWEVYSWRLEHRNELRVSAHILRAITRLPPKEANPEEWINTVPWRLQIEVVNSGRSTVKVRRVEVKTNASSGGYEVWTSNDWGLPWTLERGDERAADLTDAEAGDLARGQELLIRVITTTGQEFTHTLIVGGLNQYVTVPGSLFTGMTKHLGADEMFVAQHSVFGGNDSDDPVVRFLERAQERQEEPE
jgi:hypothetical protein